MKNDGATRKSINRIGTRQEAGDQTEGFVLKAANKGKKTKPASLDLLKDFFKAKKLGRASRICNGFSPKERVIIGPLFKT